MSKQAVFHPNYQLHVEPKYRTCSRELRFRHGNVTFITKTPLFGASETQKAALEWASQSTPPVICVKHGKPTAPDKGPFGCPHDPHRHYSPYAMAIATLECLGETTPRTIKIYFCDGSVHQEDSHHKIHWEGKIAFVEPVATASDVAQ